MGTLAVVIGFYGCLVISISVAILIGLILFTNDKMVDMTQSLTTQIVEIQQAEFSKTCQVDEKGGSLRLINEADTQTYQVTQDEVQAMYKGNNMQKQRTRARVPNEARVKVQTINQIAPPSGLCFAESRHVFMDNLDAPLPPYNPDASPPPYSES